MGVEVTCPQCGHRNPVGSRFCSSCGAALDGGEAHTTMSVVVPTHGRIPAHSWVLMRTDWSKHTMSKRYKNMNETGQHTPGPTAEAIRFLIDERDIRGFGTETIGTDAGQAYAMDPQYPAHHYLHGAGRYGLQCLTNLDKLPARMVLTPSYNGRRFVFPKRTYQVAANGYVFEVLDSELAGVRPEDKADVAAFSENLNLTPYYREAFYDAKGRWIKPEV